MLVFDEKTKAMYPERCRIIRSAYISMVNQTKMIPINSVIIIEDKTDNTEGSVAVYAGDGSDEGKWKLSFPFSEFLGILFKSHVVMAFALMLYDMKNGEGTYDEDTMHKEFNKIYSQIDPYFANLTDTEGKLAQLEVEHEE